MLHIIGLIFKILGILLLAVLGLLLFTILIVLLIPIRYKVNAEHGDEFLAVEGRASWLLHLVNVRFTHLDGQFHIKARVLWFTLYDNLKPKTPGKPKTKKSTKPDKKPDMNLNRKDSKKLRAEKLTKADKRAEALKRFEAAKNIDTAPKQETVKNQEAAKKPKPAIQLEATGKSEEVIKHEPVGQAEPANTAFYPEGTGDRAKPFTGNEPTTPNGTTARLTEENAKHGAEGFFEKIRCKIIDFIRNIIDKTRHIKDKITNIINKIKSFRENATERIRSILTSAAGVKQKISLVLDFIRDEYNRQGFQITYTSLKKLLKHILPKKLKSRIVFGTGDPCSTGQALGAMSILYSFYGDKIRIVPDFENKRFEGKHYARGRIRLVTILIIVIKLILDKRFKLLSKNFQILKEAL